MFMNCIPWVAVQINLNTLCLLRANSDRVSADSIGENCSPRLNTALSCKLATFTVTSPTTLALTLDGDALFVGSNTGNQITRIDTRTHESLPITVGDKPTAVMVDNRGGNVFVGHSDHYISQVNTSTLTVSGWLSEGLIMAQSLDSQYFASAYTEIRGFQIRRLRSTEHGFIYPSDIDYGYGSYDIYPSALAILSREDNFKLYFASEGDVYPFFSDFIIGDRLNLGASSLSPIEMTLSTNGHIYISLSNRIAIVNTETDQLIAMVNLPFQPSRTHLSADERYLYVSEFNGTGVTVIDTLQHKRIRHKQFFIAGMILAQAILILKP